MMRRGVGRTFSNIRDKIRRMKILPENTLSGSGLASHSPAAATVLPFQSPPKPHRGVPGPRLTPEPIVLSLLPPLLPPLRPLLAAYTPDRCL